jgi:uncharacterized protein with GYD domain
VDAAALGRPSAGGATMTSFYLLCRYTDEGRRAIKDAPKRLREQLQEADQAGLSVRSLHLTVGEYQYVAQVDATDEEAIVELIMGLEQHGRVRVDLLRAFGPSETDRILQRIP